MEQLKVQPKLIIHGGAGSSLKGKGGVEALRKLLYTVIDDVYSLLIQGASAKEAVVRGCQLLENEPRFNAGTGSVLQSDGQIPLIWHNFYKHLLTGFYLMLVLLS
jgi:L-asparaginase